MSYVQGFIGAVPTANRATFIEHASKAAQAFREHGCLAAVECWGDDVPAGEVTSFPRAVKATPDETVIFSWYAWPSKAVHDAAIQKAMNDPRLSPKTNPMPFDGKRVIFGGFEPVLELGTPRPGGYVDGFVVAVKRGHREAFIETSEACDPIFIERGACWIMETWGVDVLEGKLTDFRRAVQAEPDEEIAFSWIQWRDRATRDAAHAKIMKDPRMAAHDMPFDGKRLIFGGFVPVVELWGSGEAGG